MPSKPPEDMTIDLYSKNEEELVKYALIQLKSSFPRKKDSWLIRAAIRCFFTEEEGKNRWRVMGLEELGDVYPYYRVTFFETTGRYYCTCFDTSYGYVRRARICTHIAGVMVYRRVKSMLQMYREMEKEKESSP